MPGRLEKSVTEHREIYEAIAARDAALADKLTSLHIERALENMLGSETVRKAWLLAAGGNDAEIPSKCELLAVDSLLSTSLFNTVAERASADYVLFFAKNGKCHA